MYLIDKQGIIRYVRVGEGGYRQTEQQIRALLDEPMNREKVRSTNRSVRSVSQLRQQNPATRISPSGTFRFLHRFTLI